MRRVVDDHELVDHDVVVSCGVVLSPGLKKSLTHRLWRQGLKRSHQDYRDHHTGQETTPLSSAPFMASDTGAATRMRLIAQRPSDNTTGTILTSASIDIGGPGAPSVNVGLDMVSDDCKFTAMRGGTSSNSAGRGNWKS
jgi:hypothetical protein